MQYIHYIYAVEGQNFHEKVFTMNTSFGHPTFLSSQNLLVKLVSGY